MTENTSDNKDLEIYSYLNPPNEQVYYNKTDFNTYSYQDGTWKILIVDKTKTNKFVVLSMLILVSLLHLFPIFLILTNLGF